ncbi:nucleolar pre-ribosomal-associated protein 1 [Rhypophila decipiens]|uniref:Nucleolar pre-ribosomal-associated protein 1 n=1 Tax=Rhypophila decipiens TaxID=261697 RepID=A0AAN6YA35_9PEZI|nr:nucleolar pre-ribosomal-associated protein 1 [Rhypophila decipiens]
MGKRQSHGDFAGGPRKRQRIVHEAPTFENITTARQLGQLLASRQDPKAARHGLQSLKLFLDELLGQREDHSDRFRILKDYLQSTAPPTSEDEENRVYLRDIMQTWDFASQTNNDNLLSAVVVVLALILKLLSQKLDMVPFGLGVCRTLLHKRQLELISRNLSADKGKAFIISPTLRLLKEAVSFDGGAVAKPIFRARAFTLKSLARNMGIVHIGEQDEEAAKRPSARTNAVLFFLSALKLLPPEAKKELLFQRDVVTALTRETKQDPQYLLVELLSTLRDHVILDDKLPREAKSALLGGGTLMRLSTLYYYRPKASAEGKLPSVPDMVHDFLLSACTIPSCGILRSDFGFYPRGIDPDVTLPTAEAELGIQAWMGQFRNDVPVRNYILSTFLPHLRPWSNVKQSELVIAIFKVAPELFADYFIKNKSFTFDPKLSTTWIGYGAFLFQAVMLPIPKFFGGKSGFPELPPPTSIVIDNVLPLPFNQKVLTRCLAHKSKLVSFFATRILVLAIQKLDSAVKMYRTASQVNRALWDEAARSLVDEFCQRSPGIKEMINAYRAIPEEDILHREAGSLLLRLFYEVLPQVAVIAKFDVSPFLETALGRLSQSRPDDARDLALNLKELENLLAIAGYSPGMRWFSSSDSLALSPFTSLLKVYTEAPQGLELPKVREVLDSVAADHQVVAAYTSHSGLLPLLRSVQTLHKSEHKRLVDLWSFLDKCLMRCASTPVKYCGLMQNMIQEIGVSSDQSGDTGPTSPVPFAALEQLPFVVKNGESGTLQALEKFLPIFFGLLVAAGESKVLLEAVLEKMSTNFAKGPSKLPSTKTSKALLSEASDPPSTPREVVQDAESVVVNGHVFGATDSDITDEELQQMLDSSDSLSVDTSALTKWSSKTVDELIDEGYAISLISLLVSEHASIRKEAAINILKMAGKIKQSEYEEKEQIWLLLSELAETAKSVRLEVDQLPGPIMAFAGHAVRMLKDPLSVLYPKINAFLTRAPVWTLDRLPLFEEVLAEEPAVGEAYYNQLSWLLSYLLAGLRTEQDLELFHKKRAKGPVLERLLALAATSYMRLPLRIQILKLLYRVTKIKGGSTMLTTRCGILSWLDQQKKSVASPSSAGHENEARIYEALKRRVLQTGDQERIAEWRKAQAV